VVDPALRVRGIGNLRVIDSSICPTIPASNTNVAAIAIGEKAPIFCWRRQWLSAAVRLESVITVGRNFLAVEMRPDRICCKRHRRFTTRIALRIALQLIKNISSKVWFQYEQSFVF